LTKAAPRPAIGGVARKTRIEFGGACYHVINRGNYRRDLFAAKGAAESFRKCLFEAAERCGWRLHAFVIMRNHFHLAVETPEPNLSDGMKWLQGTWAARFNRFRGEVGRPFQGRYKALHVWSNATGSCLNGAKLRPVVVEN
jgi:putative transposase